MRHKWDYGKAKHEAINNAITNFEWKKAFSNISVQTQITLFNEISAKVLMNFVPNKLVTIDDGNLP